jgi:hypothetical protein
VEVRIVYFDGCPSWRTANERLREALTQAGHADAPVGLIRVESEAEAAAAGFAGSPTILGERTRLVPGAAVPDGLACHLYSTSAGLAGSPTIEELTAALTDRSRHDHHSD